MSSGMGGWAVFLVLGVLIWMTSAGALTHPAYRLVLMVAVFSWCAYIVRTPKSS